MESYQIIWMAVTGIIILIALIILLVTLRKKRTDKIGIKGEKKVAKILKPWAMMHSYKVINDLYLPLYDKTTQIDHIVIGFFGMIVIETKNIGGEVYGDVKAKEWTHVMGQQRHKLYNPVLQNKAHIDCIRHWLSKENIYNITVDNVVVFANNKTDLYLQKGDAAIIKRKELKKLLKKAKYEKDRDVDVQKLYDALMKHRVTDSALIKRHNKDVEEMAKRNR